MKTQELRDLTVDELNVKYLELKEKLFYLRFQNVTGQLEDTSQIKKVKKVIAQVLTLKNEKERSDELIKLAHQYADNSAYSKSGRLLRKELRLFGRRALPVLKDVCQKTEDLEAVTRIETLMREIRSRLSK